MLNIKTIVIGGFVAGSLFFGGVSSVRAEASETFTDSTEIGNWSADAVNDLVMKGYLVGYPDGSFRPKEDISREEFSVILYKLIADLDYAFDYYYNSSNSGDRSLAKQIQAQQLQLLQLSATVDAIGTDEFVKNNNFVGIGLIYTINQSEGTFADVELYGKYQLVQLTDKLAVSVRGSVDTNTVLTLGASLDYDVTDRFEVFVGAGGAYLLDQNNTSVGLTGANDEVVPIAIAGGQYAISDSTGVYVKGSIPLTVDQEEDSQVSAGFTFNF